MESCRCPISCREIFGKRRPRPSPWLAATPDGRGTARGAGERRFRSYGGVSLGRDQEAAGRHRGGAAGGSSAAAGGRPSAALRGGWRGAPPADEADGDGRTPQGTDLLPRRGRGRGRGPAADRAARGL